jgi:hypothetical protein
VQCELDVTGVLTHSDEHFEKRMKRMKMIQKVEVKWDEYARAVTFFYHRKPVFALHSSSSNPIAS